MIFTETKLKGAFVVDIERRVSTRGAFSRAFFVSMNLQRMG